MRRPAWAIAAVAIMAVIGARPSQAYYYFVHSLKSGSVPEKFDLTALQNNTLSFFVSENGPTTYAPYDTFNSVLGQIQQAVAIWNGVASSSLRVSFGGMENAATLQNTPGGDVIFEDLPPGVEGFGGPTSVAANPATAADGTQFFPIVRSVVHLSLNLNQHPGPSYDQSFLMTVLHEMGHAMGLQHTFTSATMSQATTRATTLAHPLGADDVAGLSALYPAAIFAQFGSISGTITAGGQPVSMASVVAMQPGADAISAVTNPDGTYMIAGIPPGQYSIYVQSMPPDADVFGPDGNEVTSFQAVDSLFYPGTTDFSEAAPVTVAAGQVTSGINVQTTARASVPLYDGQVYGYFDNGALETYPAPVQITPNETAVVASIVGLGSSEPVSGLGVQFPSGEVSIAPNGIAAQQYNGYTYADLYLNFSTDAQPGEQHMIFTTPDYMYVLPSAMYLTLNGPPTISAVSNNGDGTLTLTGTNWNPSTLLYFDSLPAAIVSLNPTAGTAIVIPPTGVNGQVSTLTAYNPDGQNSQMLQTSSLCILPGLAGCPVTYSYGNSLPTPVITAISPSSLPAGADAMVDITGSGFSFAPGAATIGFGSSDVLVQQVFVLSPNHVQVDVSVAPGAALSTSDVTAISGFQLVTAPAAFQITAAAAELPAPYPILFNGLPGLTGSYAGAIVSLYGANLAAPNATPSITIDGQAATILYSSPTQINLVIPANLPPGPAPMVVNNGILSDTVVVNINAQPAGIAAIQSSTGAYIDSSSPAYQGEPLIVTLTNLGSGAAIAPSRVQVGVGGVSHNATQVNAVEVGSAFYYQVFFQLNANDPVGAAEPLIVYLDGLSSVPASIQVLPAPAGSQ